LPLRNSQHRYGSIAIGLHWLSFAVVAAAYVSVEVIDFFPKGNPWRDALKDLHRSFGLLVFALILPRLMLYWADVKPDIVPLPSAIEQKLANIAHWLLYALLVLLPIIGYLMTDMAGKNVVFFGTPLPHFVGESKSLAKLLKEVHELLGNAGLAVIGVHAGAALYHHYFQRDNTLRRMLPGGGT
jgi:superoxide oxidase